MIVLWVLTIPRQVQWSSSRWCIARGWPQTTHLQIDWSSRSVALLNNKQTSGRKNVYPGARDRYFEAQVWDYQDSDWASQAHHLGEPRLGTVTLGIGYVFLCQFSQSKIMQTWPPIKGSWTKELSILSMLPQQKLVATWAKVNTELELTELNWSLTFGTHFSVSWAPRVGVSLSTSGWWWWLLPWHWLW